MNKKIISGIVFTIIIILLCVWVLNFFGVFTPAKTLSGQNSDDTYLLKAGQTGDVSFCNKIKEEEKANRCFLLIAKKNKDIDYCDNIKSSVGKEKCIEEYETAVEAGSQRMKDSEHRATAISESDISKCDRIANENFKANCKLQISLLERDETNCNTIIDLELKESCKEDVIHLNKAINKFGDLLPKCEERDFVWRDSCFLSEAVNTGEEKWCYFIKFNSRPRSSCFESLGIKNNDIELCQQVEVPSQRDNCLFKVAKSTDTVTENLCNSLENYGSAPFNYKDSCFEGLTN